MAYRRQLTVEEKVDYATAIFVSMDRHNRKNEKIYASCVDMAKNGCDTLWNDNLIDVNASSYSTFNIGCLRNASTNVRTLHNCYLKCMSGLRERVMLLEKNGMAVNQICLNVFLITDQIIFNIFGFLLDFIL